MFRGQLKRPAVAAHKLAADRRGRALFFSKENHSNGCIATVDVTYPSAPLYLLTAPALLGDVLYLNVNGAAKQVTRVLLNVNGTAKEALVKANP